MPTFTRLSEYEGAPSFCERADGVWADMFLSDWIQEGDIAPYLIGGKKVCLVSPDLHQRDPEPFWKRLQSWDCASSAALMLCTDRPEEARELFS